jgi:ribosomal protein S18 acetylase RimI-like enzyme
MSDTIIFSINRSSASEIAAHLVRVDASFEPLLSSRVDIRTYGQKIYDRAVRFEAWLGEKLIGLVASYCNEHDSGNAFMTSVSVWPEYQGQGVASQLMHHSIEHVRGLGFRQIELEVNERNLQAIALYQKLRFNILCRNGSTLTMCMKLERKQT